MNQHKCRACGEFAGALVLDLGDQPACDYFPRQGSPGSDPVYPLQMWLCSSCGLAQLLTDPTVPEEPKAKEPMALVLQAADAVERVAAAGLLPAGAVVAEYGSPHGGSWLDLLAARGLAPAASGASADVIVDCFGMMHAADQHAALAERTARIRPGGVLLLQYHSLNTIISLGQWNALRHGHYAYYSTSALTAMLARHGFSPRTAWQFDLYGGTVLLAARRDSDGHGPADGADDTVRTILAEEARTSVRDPETIRGLQRDARAHAARLHDWLVKQRSAGSTVLGYGAASRAVTLLLQAQADRSLLPAIVDASPAKQGLRMPGTDIPIVGTAELAARRPGAVLVFVPDLLPEIRKAFPEIEAAGARWVNVEAHGSTGLQ
jgi:hypothetical protein